MLCKNNIYEVDYGLGEEKYSDKKLTINNDKLISFGSHG